MDAPRWRSSAVTLTSLFGHLERLGAAPQDVAEPWLIKLAETAGPEGRIPTRALIDLLERCATVLGDPLFGLRYGQAIDPHSLGSPSLFWRHAPSFRYSLVVTARFLHLHYGGVSLSVTEDAGAAQIVQRMDVGLRPNARQSIETNISFGVNVGRWILGDGWKPLQVSFSHEAACAPSQYAEVLRAPVSFGALEDALIVTPADLDRPAVDRNPLRLHLSERTLLTRAIGEPLTLRRRVEQAVDDLLRLERPSVGAAAASLGMSVRSLQRRLRDEETSFQALLAEARMRAVERERLRSAPTTLAVLADRTRYSDATAVSRFLRNRGRK